MMTQKELIIEFMKNLSLCHECVSEIDDAGQLVFKGPSPDDEALVEFAKNLGFVFNGATD